MPLFRLAIALLLLLPAAAFGQAITPVVPPPSPPGQPSVASAPAPLNERQARELRALCNRADASETFSLCAGVGAARGEPAPPQPDASRSAPPPAGPAQQAFESYQVAYYEYLGGLARYSLDLLAWQTRASEVLLWVVVVVVASGLLFSGFQLWRSLKLGQAIAQSQIELSASKVQVTTSIAGIVVLVISVAFLYLFIHEVYTIRTLDQAPPATAPAR